MYMGDIKVNTRVLAEEEKYCEKPGWRKGISVPVDSRGKGEHKKIISQMEQGGEKDRKLLGILNTLTEQQSIEDESENGPKSEESEPEQLVEGEAEQQSIADESENAPKSEESEPEQLVEGETDKQDIVDKSHSLELESAPESHTKQTDTAIVMRKVCQ